MTYTLRLSSNFKKVYKKKEQAMQAAIKRCMSGLTEIPRRPGLNVHKMQGQKEDVWEAYIDRANRVTFHYEGNVIVLRNNCNHDILNNP